MKGVSGNEEVNTVLTDSLMQGEVKSAVYASSNYEAVFLLNHSQGDLDLHIYDAAGHHTGYNYQTGETETSIPNSVYNHAASMITITNATWQQFNVQVQGVQTEGYQQFGVTAIETSEQQPTMEVSTPAIPLTGGNGDTVQTVLLISELGCHHQVTGVNPSASVLAGPGFNIPADNVVFDSDSNSIGPGLTLSVPVRVIIPTNAPSGDYVGSLQVSSVNAGSGDASLTIRVGARPSTPGAPVGPTSAVLGIAYQYSGASAGPSGDTATLVFDWGDSTGARYCGPVTLGDTCSVTHEWTNTGTYSVRVRAHGKNGVYSLWSNPLIVTTSALCGDASGDQAVDISDAVYLINYIFSGGPAPNPLEAGDASCDGSVDISDAVYLIAYIFAGGPAPCAECK
jgi:hypothetical protein